MSAETPTCARCRVAMDLGFIQDHKHHDSVLQSQWVEGAPEPSKWLWLDLGVKTKGRKVLPMRAYRCPRCGLVEIHA